METILPNGYFASSFIHEAPSEAVSRLHWGGGARNCTLAQLLPRAHILPKDIENSFSFMREAASPEKLLEELF